MASVSIVRLLARRFLTGKKRNNFLSFISAISLFGVALGVAALVTVMGVMEGFESELRSVITGTHSHVVLYSNRHLISNRFELMERIKTIAPEIEAISPYIFSEVMLAHGSRVAGSMLEGIEESSAKEATQLTQHIVGGIYPKNSDGEEMPTIILGSALAETLGAKVGDEIRVISPFFEADAMAPKTKKFRLASVMATGMYEYDSKYSLITAYEASDFFSLPSAGASALKIKTPDASTSWKVAEKLKNQLGYPYVARDWTELNHNLLYAIRLQKAVIFVILTAIVVVAAFNIMSTLVMMMSEKKKEMSILKAMGMSPKQSARVFVMVGFIIGASGALAGICLGLILCLILSKTRFIQLPPDVYFISYLPVDVHLPTLLLIGASAIFVAFVATLYPSWRVAAESPVEGLRYE